MFKIPNLNSYSGFDLMSYDIQRGRDNGLPPYNKMRRVCGLAKANKFADLSDFISKKVQKMYNKKKLLLQTFTKLQKNNLTL